MIDIVHPQHLGLEGDGPLVDQVEEIGLVLD
jgi:hypothetical protein